MTMVCQWAFHSNLIHADSTHGWIFILADAAFHRKIAEAARNTLFLSIYDALSDIRSDASWSNLGENAKCFKRQALYAHLHGELVEAIAARDGERAHQVMYSHLSDVQNHIAQKMFPTLGEAD